MFGPRIRWIVFVAIVVAVIAVAVANTWPNLVRQDLLSFIQPMTTFVIAIAGLLVILQVAYTWLFGKPSPAQTEINRASLMSIMRRVWINGDGEHPGVLEDALRDAYFDIDLKIAPDRAGRSQAYEGNIIMKPTAIIRRGEREPLHIDTTPDALAKAYYDNDRQILILGAAGSGKSVLLLQLASRLLDDAAIDKMKAVPVVINLSSWAIKRLPMQKWLIGELRRGAYGVSKRQVHSWIKADALIYLLDGLDEVAEEHRVACLRALNKFIVPERQVVVCSRSDEYAALDAHLDVRNAVEIQPFTPGQFEAYVRDHLPVGQTVEDALVTLRADPDVWVEVQKPLFANILISTYRDGKTFAAVSTEGTVLSRVRQLVIEPYVTRQLQNAAGAPHSNTDTRKYMSWLGWQLRSHELTTFYVEALQVDWLRNAGFRLLQRVLSVLMFWLALVPPIGLWAGLLGLQGGNLALGLTFGLTFGLASGITNGTMAINVEQRLRISWRELVGGLANGLAGGLVGGLVGWFAFGLGGSLAGALFGGLVVGFSLGLGGAMANGLIGFSSVLDRTTPSQGIWDTFLLGLIMAPTLGLAGWLLAGQVFGSSLGLAIGLTRGPFDIIRHLILRCLLYAEQNTPLRFDKLLYHARDRRLMRQVGGGFIFIHRYVLEYFAAYWEEHYQRP
ncbi:MAG: NACHT domain-containing protein [Anaerolineae bacterium]|nr:NACHT domain-containing protein [Anaerolineae bacterium]